MRSLSALEAAAHEPGRSRPPRAEFNCARVTIAVLAVFAVMMELLFPPCRVVFESGSSVYAGHFIARDPLLNVQIDYLCLLIELFAVTGVATAGWILGRTR